MREAELRNWLKQRSYQGKPLTTKGIESRLRRSKRIERALTELGFDEHDLDAIHAAGRWPDLTSALRAVASDWRGNEAAARRMAPEAEDPRRQLANLVNTARQYGHFADGKPPNYDTEGDLSEDIEDDEGTEPVADRVRAYVIDTFIDPARLRKETSVTVRAGDVHNALNLSAAHANVCQAMRGGKMQRLAGVSAPTSIGPDNSSTTTFTYSFLSKTAGIEMTDKELLARFDSKAEFASWRSGWSAQDLAAFVRIVRTIHGEGADWFHINHDTQVRCGRKDRGRIRASSVYAVIYGTQPKVWVRQQRDRNELNLDNTDLSLSDFANIIEENVGVLSRFDNRPGLWPDELAAELVSDEEYLDPKQLVIETDMAAPTNLILYGPPGTGKTFATAEKAVMLCGEAVPAERAELMKAYQALQADRRIAFVTFHQNYSYEEFVEGLRPETSSEDNSSAGFRLEPRSGIFREMCALAEQARTRDGSENREQNIDLSGRRFWKMGLGTIGSEDDVYEDAVAGEYIALGWGGTVDWSDKRFSSFKAIKDEWLDKNPDNTTPSNWTQTWPFRCEMKPGDIVIVPYGNSAFRAVAEVTGDYYFEASAEGYFAHRRAVRWLLTLDEPLPLDAIVDGNFTMRALYSIANKRVNLSALSRLLSSSEGEERSSGQAPPDQFVLIIDEINRANISRVFGELITLLEPDKRLGMPNALTVTLPYSKKRDFGVPANLHIVGTMNTADRSIALLDTALRRRFDFEELMPRPELLNVVEGIDLSLLLTTINERIEYLFDREHQIGHAYFLSCAARSDVDAVMRRKVIPLLAEYFYEDWAKVAMVLGDDGTGNNGFIARQVLMAPPGLQSGFEATARYRWSLRAEFDYRAFSIE